MSWRFIFIPEVNKQKEDLTVVVNCGGENVLFLPHLTNELAWTRADGLRRRVFSHPL
jgi:hypothetical protein